MQGLKLIWARKRLVLYRRLNLAFAHCNSLTGGKGLLYSYLHEHSNKVDSFFAAMLNHGCCIHQLNCLNQSNIYCSRRELKFGSWILPPSWLLYFFLKYFLARNMFLNFRSKFWGTSNIILFTKQAKCLPDLRPKCQSWSCYKIWFSYLWKVRQSWLTENRQHLGPFFLLSFILI